MKRITIICTLGGFSMSFSVSADAAHDKTHIAVGEAALAYNLAAPDVAKLKAYEVEEYNQWVNNKAEEVITPALVRGSSNTSSINPSNWTALL